MGNWGVSIQKLKAFRFKGKISPFVFFLTLCFTTAISLHALAVTDSVDDPLGDKYPPKWCPPSTDPGLAVICGTVVTNKVVEVEGNLQQPQAPVDNVLVAAYEENERSPTGKISGMLTNPVSSTITNKMGRYRLLIRRVKPANLKVHLVFMCGTDQPVQHNLIDSWHNMWGIVTQVDCDPSSMHAEDRPADRIQPSPPMPLLPTPNYSFLGCTNNFQSDNPIGLEKKEEPTINTVVSEDNYDHRFNLNPVVIESNFDFFNIPMKWNFTFVSPGGLWEPDCLLRNKKGTYQCNSAQCPKWNNGIIQPCTPHNPEGLDPKACENPANYPAAKLYARNDCHGDPNDLLPEGTWEFLPDGTIPDSAWTNPDGREEYKQCKERQALYLNDMQEAIDNQDWDSPVFDKVDGVLCDSGPTTTPPSSLIVMAPDDYLTRPFFKYIPKSEGEYSQPFRRLENRNNLKNYALDALAPHQWMSAFLGSGANTAVGFAPITFRGFTGTPQVPAAIESCEALFKQNQPKNDNSTQLTFQNGLITAGPLVGLSEPGELGPYQQVYYSGQRDLSDYICQKSDGEKVRICEIQVPWGPGSVCNVQTDGSCKDPDFSSKLRSSLARLYMPNTLIDPVYATQIETNIQNMLANCQQGFKISKAYFPKAAIFATGNTQMGFHSDTPNDSTPAYAERRNYFVAAGTEQEAPAQTGSRVVFQEGDALKRNSYNSIFCAINAQWCTNNKKARAFESVLYYPNIETDEDFKKVYIDKTDWSIDNLSPGQTPMCSISNTFQTDIKGPEEELLGLASQSGDENIANHSDEFGGAFDPLFTGNIQHKGNWVAGTAIWYMSENALLRDEVLKTGGSPQFIFMDPDIAVGTNNGYMDFAFKSLLGREIWDSILTLAGGDGNIHNMHADLLDVKGAIVAALSGDPDWKSFANRSNGGGIIPATKPYYNVTFKYPLTEETFKSKFRLPGQVLAEDGGVTYEETPLRPAEWGPGHICYNFDIEVPKGQICGTYREAPEGISRTCRVDKCVNFKRVETAQCECWRKSDDPSDPLFNKFKCKTTNHEVRNLIIEDCGREERLQCAVWQETSRPWEAWPDGYDICRKWRYQGGEKRCEEWSPYYRDLRTGEETTGNVFPPDDIDMRIAYEDHSPEYEPSRYKPPHIDDALCNPDLFDWSNENETRHEKTIVGPAGRERPRCWVSAAGPFRKYPSFSPAGETAPLPAADGEEIDNCNGYVKVEDHALRAAQNIPYPEYGQVQKNLDKSTDVGVVLLRTFMPPMNVLPPHGGNKVAYLDSNETNNANSESGLLPDAFTRGQQVNMGGVGDISTLKSIFGTPMLGRITTGDAKLEPMQFHCDPQGHNVEDANKETGDIQKEIVNVLTTFDPDGDGTPGWACPIVPAPEPQIPKIDGKGGSCNVAKFGECQKTINEVLGLPDEEGNEYSFSGVFKDLINWSAYQSNTPGGALLAVMLLEGGLDPQYVPLWNRNEDTYKTGIRWFDQFKAGGPASCNNLVWSAQGPYQLIKKWVTCLVDPIANGCSPQAVEVSARFCAKMNIAGEGRCESVINAGRCNMLDASMAAAFLMNPEAGMHPGNCSGFDIMAALKLFSGGSYKNENVNVDAALKVYKACSGTN